MFRVPISFIFFTFSGALHLFLACWLIFYFAFVVGSRGRMLRFGGCWGMRSGVYLGCRVRCGVEWMVFGGRWGCFGGLVFGGRKG